MIKEIVFDADGMVVTGDLFSDQFSSDFRVPTNLITPFFENGFSGCVLGQADLKEELRGYLLKNSWGKSVEEVVDYWLKCNHLDQRMILLIKNLKEKGIKCFLATNQEKYRLDYFKNELNLSRVFDGIFCSCEWGCRKPDKEFFDRMMSEIPGIKKEEIMFCDDREVNIAKAKEYGFATYLYRDFADFKSKISSFLS